MSHRYPRIADQFTARVEAVPPDAWGNATPCEGWVARDVVDHLVEWVPGFFANFAGVELRATTWAELDAAIRRHLDDEQTFEVFGTTHTFASAIEQFVTADVLVHTWDLARACGLDERLDPEAVHELFEGMAPAEEAMRASEHYGPRVEVPDDAAEQTKLIAFTGRRP